MKRSVLFLDALLSRLAKYLAKTAHSMFPKFSIACALGMLLTSTIFVLSWGWIISSKKILGFFERISNKINLQWNLSI
jgi:hypothetical protein